MGTDSIRVPGYFPQVRSREDPPEPYPELDPTKIVVVESFELLLVLLLLGFTVFLNVGIFKLVKFRDLVMLASILSITLALTCMMLFNIMDIYI